MKILYQNRAAGLLQYCYNMNKLAGVPGVARDDQWRNLIALFPEITKETE